MFFIVNSGSPTVHDPWCDCVKLLLFLSLQAGVVDEMNELAVRFMAESEEREGLLTKASTAAEECDNPE